MALQFDHIPGANAEAPAPRLSFQTRVECRVKPRSPVDQSATDQADRAVFRYDKVGAFAQDRRPAESAALERNVQRYIAGWAAGDSSQILLGATKNYRFRDPFVGTFDRASLPDYFAILRGRLDIKLVRCRAIRIALRGVSLDPAPMCRVQVWREVLDTGLTGASMIEFKADRISFETVCYDLTLSTEQLRRGYQNRE